jgi:hypothetical protein
MLKPASSSSLDVNFRKAMIDPSNISVVPVRATASRRSADATASRAHRSLRSRTPENAQESES